MTNPSHAARRTRILGSNMHIGNLRVKNPHPCCLCAITCSGGQLKWGLRVVLRPILQGALHIRSVIQQQLWRGGEREGGSEGGREEGGENKPAGRVGRKKTNRGETVCYTRAWQEEKPQLNHLI